MREEDTVARFTGDEFGILVEELESPSTPQEVADRIRSELARPFELFEED